MATTLFDVSEDNPGGAFSGWGVQTSTGATVVGDTTVLITGLLTTKHTVVDSLGSVDRADTVYNNVDYVSPAGSLGMAVGSSSWWRKAIKLHANYVPQGGAQPRFNVLADWHGSVTVYTPLAIAINQATGKWCVEINGGGADVSTPTSSRFYDMMSYNTSTIDFRVFVKLSGDTTGQTIVKASEAGGTLTTWVSETGPIGCTGETSWYLKTAHYRRGSLGGGTTSVYHSGWIRGDAETDLAVPTAGTHKIGYLSGGVPVTGVTVNVNGVGRRGSGPFTMSEDGTLTHLASYDDFTGTGQTQSLLALYTDVAGVPVTKLGQTRICDYNPATEASGFKELQLCQSVSRSSGQKVWVIQEFETGAANIRSRLDASGTNSFFSQTSGWAAPIGPPTPIGANTTVNPNRTMSVYALYTTPSVDSSPPSSSCSVTNLTTNPFVSVAYTASDDVGLGRVDLYAKAPPDSVYSYAGTDVATSVSDSGTILYTFGGGYGTYRFYTVATDALGNVEDAPLVADCSVTYSEAGYNVGLFRDVKPRAGDHGLFRHQTGG